MEDPMKVYKLTVIFTLGLCLLSASRAMAEDPQVETGRDQAAESQASDPESSGPKPFTQLPWSQPPQVRITQWGEELRLEVLPSELMEKEQMMDIDSVGLHTEQGDLLGFKTFDSQDTERRAEFMVDPKALKLEKVKVVVHGIRLNEWSVVTPLAVTEKTTPPAVESAPLPAEEIQAEPGVEAVAVKPKESKKKK